MDGFINTWIAGLNSMGRGFCYNAAAMFLQVSVLVAVLLAVDVLLRHHLRATVRYWIWMLVFVKLLLPPSLSLPTGIGYWWGGCAALFSAVSAPAPERGEPPLTRAEEAAATPTTDPTAAEPVGPVVVPHEHLTWQAILLLFWGGGVLVLGGWVIQRLFFVRRLVAQSRPVQGEALEMLDQCRRRMGIRQNVGLRLSSGSYSPAVCGLVKPTILVPSVLLERLSPDRLRPVLIHELAHVQRGDLWVNCLQTALQIIYFYNPLVWLAGALVRRVREQAVDEMTLVALGAEAGSYSGTLIDIAEMAFLRASSALGLVGVAESKKALEGRIRHMVARPKPTSARVGTWGLLGIFASATVLLPMAQAQRQNAAVPAPQATTEQGAVAVLNGVTVELVGLCQNPAAKGQPWWRPDGTSMEEPEVRALNPSKYPAVGFLLKFTPAKDVDYRSQTPLVRLPGSQVQITPDGQAAVLYGSNRPLTEPLPNQADIEVDVAAGEWSMDKPITTRARRAGTGPLYRQTAQTPDGHDIILSGLRPNPRPDEMSKTLVEVTTSATDVDVCPECTTTDGRRLAGHFSEGPLFSDGHLLQRTFGFAAAIEEMQTIAIKQRPFHHVVFRNVSLQAGHKTMVGVETPGSQNQAPGSGTPVSANPETPDRVTVMSRLRPLALAALMYANDHKSSLASDVAELRPYLGNEDQFTWIAAHVEYLGKGVNRNEGASPAARPLAYWKTPTTTEGTVVAFLDGHVEYVDADRLAKLGIVISVPAAGPQGTVQTYEVNRVVADFPPTGDMSTPEAAYATINRIDRNDPSAWQKVSTAALAKRMARAGAKREAVVDAEWAKVLANARILQVVVRNNTRAMVVAQLPQALSGKKIVTPMDVRYLQREDGRWLNTGNDRFWTVEEAMARFRASVEKAGGTPASVPALPQGISELFGLSKDDLLAKYGRPNAVSYDENRYSLNNPPEQYYMSYEDRGLSFRILANRVIEVTLLRPAYVFSNGVRVGDSEAKVKQAFGPDYVVKEFESRDLLIYQQLDVSFEVHKPDRIVGEINIGRNYGRPHQTEQKGGEEQRVELVNLSQIGKACLLYANDHEDHLPPDLQTLVKEMNLSPTVLESTRKPKDFTGPSYIYVPGQSVEMYPGNIVAYENPEFSAGGANVLFLDSHVEFMKAEMFREELGTTYERLGRPVPEVKFQDEVGVKPRPAQPPQA